ncbi:MAG: hypothetical protein U1A78_33760 [Polyangia bacterium]
MGDFNKEAAGSALKAIHNVSSAVLKGQAKVLDQAWPGASTVINAGTEALGDLWQGLGWMPGDKASSPSGAPPVVQKAPEPPSLPPGAPPAVVAPPAAPPAPPPDPPAAAEGLFEQLPEKARRYLASKGVLSLPPPPPADARGAPPVVSGTRLPAAEAKRAQAADGKRLGL